jgi:hypothetical protein
MIKKPSVSDLIKLLDKPGLLNWSNKLGLDGIVLQEAQKKYRNDGTSLHSQIKTYIKYGIPMLIENNQIALDYFLKNKKVIACENKIETKYFTGRYDLKYECNYNICIGDFKLNGGVYLENKLQLVAYGMAEQCDELIIIRIPGFYIEETSIVDRYQYEEILKHLSAIYYLKKEIDND